MVKSLRGRDHREKSVQILSFPYGLAQPCSALRSIVAVYWMNESMPKVLAFVILKLEGNIRTFFPVMKMEYFRRKRMMLTASRALSA